MTQSPQHLLLCLTLLRAQVYHPNIDHEGKICLNILREDWKPVLSISSVVYGLQFLFLDPNPGEGGAERGSQLCTTPHPHPARRAAPRRPAPPRPSHTLP